MTQAEAINALNIHNRPTPTGSDRPQTYPTYRSPSEMPTQPAPRPLAEDQVKLVLLHYRRQSAKLASLAARLREMGIDPQTAWDPHLDV